MKIQIDCREKELMQQCEALIQCIPKFKTLCLTSCPLELGDIIISDEEVEKVIIERKTLRDLAASIKDGRYAEQSYRLNGIPHHNHNIIYLFEGDITTFNTFRENIDKQTIYSAMFSVNYFKGFSVMRSMTIMESAMIICNMAYKLDTDDGKRGGFYNNVEDIATDISAVTPEKEYCSVVKKNKKENITIENIGEIMLCQIPGVSATTAIAILKVFNTLPALVEAIKLDKTCLSNICNTDANGKTRKINKTTLTNVVKFLSV